MPADHGTPNTEDEATYPNLPGHCTRHNEYRATCAWCRAAAENRRQARGEAGTPNTGDERDREVEGSFHVDMCPDCGAVPFQHPMDPPWFCDHPRDRYVMVEVAPVVSPSRDGTVAVEALRAIRTFAGEGPHTHMGEACGIDACVGCLIYATADEALAEFGVSERTERIDEDRV